MRSLAPLDYRYALDAAMSTLAGIPQPLVKCGVHALQDEVSQRIPVQLKQGPALGGLWIEPLSATWNSDLHLLLTGLAFAAPLVIVASRPLARLIPERASWDGQPLGLKPGGLGRLRRALTQMRWTVESSYGIHSALAIALSVVGQQLERIGRPDLGDRLHFAARLRYCNEGVFSPLSTVAVLVVRKGQLSC